MTVCCVCAVTMLCTVRLCCDCVLCLCCAVTMLCTVRAIRPSSHRMAYGSFDTAESMFWTISLILCIALPTRTVRDVLPALEPPVSGGGHVRFAHPCQMLSGSLGIQCSD